MRFPPSVITRAGLRGGVFFVTSLWLACSSITSPPSSPEDNGPSPDARPPGTGKDAAPTPPDRALSLDEATIRDQASAAEVMDAGSSLSPLVISEIMYHPVLENAAIENHEFVEIANRTDQSVALDGWILQGDVTFSFVAGSAVPPRGFVVVAKSRAAVLALKPYALDPAVVVGEYAGELSNGGGTVELLNAAGTVADQVKYSDKFPWPLGADALGGGEGWLPPEVGALTSHQYLGRSLERVDLTLPSDDLTNWVASPLDGATPGRRNASAGEALPVVEKLAMNPQAGPGIVRPDQPVAISVGFSGRGIVSSPKVEYFVDDLTKTGEPTLTQPLLPIATGLQAVLPGQPANALIRYRIVGDRGHGAEIISPRPSDPYRWHLYVVSPVVNSQARLHQILISPKDWGTMWTNIQAGQVATGQCAVNANWNARVPATFVHDGVAYDVQVRYMGGYIHRTEGQEITQWPYPAPATGPKPLRALGWKIEFPNWSPFGGRQAIYLNKLNQSCPGLDSYLGGELMRAAGVPAAHVQFARLHINGGYYHYMMELESHDQDLLQAFYGKGAGVGDYFKSKGTFQDQGPFGPGDERVLKPACGYTAVQRYSYVYKRKTNSWKGHDDLAQMLADLGTARTAGGATLKTFVAKTFDIPSVLSYMAVRNWGGVWDDDIHNHLLYRRPDGKWLVTATDFDQDYGTVNDADPNARRTADSSFFFGEENNPENKLGWNLVKDAFYKAYRAEYVQKLQELRTTVLKPENVTKMLDAGVAAFSMTDWMQSPAKVACDVTTRVGRMRKWIPARDLALQRLVATPVAP